MSAIVGMMDGYEAPDQIADLGHLMMGQLQQFPCNDAKVWQENIIFLGCRAQWITPQSYGECMPYYDEDLMLAITADVIVDNRDELIQLLGIGSNRRYSITDSELILKAYMKWGQETPRYVLGDYAFMIWDKKRRQLFGARDLAGNRTLYYYHDHHRFVFSTTIAPLLALPYIKKELNEEWLAEFLAIPYLLDSTDSETTVYKNIRQVPPAHSITFAGENIHLSRYGSFIPEETLQLRSGEEYVEAFQGIFGEAINSRLRTQREVAATLSGGLDSGAVASFAARSLKKQGKQLYTYSFVPAHDFVDWTGRNGIADETPYIRDTVAHVGNIEPNYLPFPNASPYKDMDECLELMEMPYKFIENSFWIRGFYEQASLQGAGILLTGARGNHSISWGSAVDYYAYLLKRMQWLRFYREFKLFSRHAGIRRTRLFPSMLKYTFPFLSRSYYTSKQEEPPLLINPDFAQRTGVREKLGRALSDDYVHIESDRKDHFQNAAVFGMQGTISTKMSLRYAIWDRDPTCDPRVVRFCLSVPIEQYVQGGIGRSLIRRATAGYLPDQVRLNHTTRGIQGADWLHRMLPSWERFREELEQMCNDSAIADFIHLPYLNDARARFVSAPRPELAFDPDIRNMMRSLVVYRFMRRNF